MIAHLADVVAAVREELEPEVAGFAATDPAVSEDPQDSSTYAANRRLETVYED